MSIEQANLAEFLVIAKRNTYAKDGEAGEKLLEDGGKALEFKQGTLRYRDVYYGFNPFAGEEVVWNEGKPAWAMNYYGNIESGEVALAAGFYEFLKKALSQVTAEAPYRGPKQFSEGGFKYVNNWSGDVGEFSGSEAISHNGDVAYRLHYHGGIVENKQ